MNQAVLTGVQVSVADYDSAVLDAARGALEGYTDDYYFFQYNVDTWVLVMYDDGIVSPFGISATDATVIQIGRNVVDIPYSVSHNVHGTLVGTEEQIFNGSYYTTEHTYTTSYFIDSYTAASVVVQNPDGYLVYGSAPNMPHLIEGVQNYEYAQTFLLVGICLFVLFDRIFRRVY